MIPELLLLSDHLRARTPIQRIEDRLLADIGLTRADLSKQKTWFGRKPRYGRNGSSGIHRSKGISPLRRSRHHPN